MKRRRPYGGVKIKTIQDIYQLLQNQTNLNREVVTAVHLDNEMKVLDVTTEAVGGRNRSLLPMENIFRGALLRNTEALVIVHNHPSGTLEASTQDKESCQVIKKAGEIIGIPVIDCVVISKRGAIKV